MPTKQPASAAPQPTVEERRAAKIAAWKERRRQRGKPTDGGPTMVTLVGAGKPAGPEGGYHLVNVPQPVSEIEVTYVSR